MVEARARKNESECQVDNDYRQCVGNTVMTGRSWGNVIEVCGIVTLKVKNTRARFEMSMPKLVTVSKSLFSLSP